jgi:hypothetical protein
VIQAIHNGIEIEMELRQLTHGYWKCDYALIKHPKGTTIIHRSDKEFPTMDLAREAALRKLAMQSITPGRVSQTDDNVPGE